MTLKTGSSGLMALLPQPGGLRLEAGREGTLQGLQLGGLPKTPAGNLTPFRKAPLGLPNTAGRGCTGHHLGEGFGSIT